jgi:hypothetical protein
LYAQIKSEFFHPSESLLSADSDCEKLLRSALYAQRACEMNTSFRADDAMRWQHGGGEWEQAIALIHCHFAACEFMDDTSNHQMQAEKGRGKRITESDNIINEEDNSRINFHLIGSIGSTSLSALTRLQSHSTFPLSISLQYFLPRSFSLQWTEKFSDFAPLRRGKKFPFDFSSR